MRDYYYVQAEKMMSDGNPPNGYAKGFFWQHGFSGPHPKREAERIMSCVGGKLVSCEEAESAIDAIATPSKPVSSPKKADTKFSADDLNEDDSMVDDVEESMEDVDDTPDELPAFDDIGYNAAISTMQDAGFDYKAVGGGRKKAQVKKAWNAFRDQS